MSNPPRVASAWRRLCTWRSFVGEHPLHLVTAISLLCLRLSDWTRPLMLPDEGRYVGITWEMIVSGNWLVPKMDGMPFFHKPPLFYWLEAVALQLFGTSERVGRTASLLAALLVAGGLCVFLRKHVGARSAQLATGILISLPLFFGGAQFANLDMLVAGLIGTTVLAGADTVLSHEQQQPWRSRSLLTFALAGCAVLTKGLIGFVLPTHSRW